MKPQFNDYLSLWLLKIAKFRRKTLTLKNHKDISSFYEEFFEEKDMESYLRDQRMEVRRQTISNCLREIVGHNINLIDVGCGLGDVLSSMPKTFKLYGMDYAQSNTKVAAQRLRGIADIRQGSIYDIPFETESMDVCVCLEVLEHIEDDVHGVTELARILKPNGILIASVPYTHYWPDYFRLMGHFRHYNRESFTKLLRENGFVVEKYLPNFPNWHQAYTCRYSLIRAEAMIFGKLFGYSSIYNFKWPWKSKTAIENLSKNLNRLYLNDLSIDYSQEDTSTFLLARKKKNR